MHTKLSVQIDTGEDSDPGFCYKILEHEKEKNY
jgi:hypothetical protein